MKNSEHGATNTWAWRHWIAAKLLSAVVLVGSLVILLGWVFDIQLLREIIPKVAIAKVGAAVELMLSALAIGAYQKTVTRSGGRQMFIRVLAVVIVLIAGALLFGIDQWLWQKSEGLFSASSRGGMAFGTAAGFMMLGIGLLVLESGVAVRNRIAQVIAIAVGFLGLFSCIGYLFNADISMAGFYLKSAVALYTAVAFVLLGAALLFSTTGGLMDIIGGRMAGSRAMRRMLPVAIVFPIALEWMCVREGMLRISNENILTEAAMFINIVFMAAYIFGAAFVMNKEDARRRRAEECIVDMSRRDMAILESIGDAVFAIDKKGKITVFNRTAEMMTGMSAGEAIGKWYGDIVEFIREDDGMPGNDFIVDAIARNKTDAMANHALLVGRNGRRMPVASSVAPVRIGGGDNAGFVVVFRDMTQERKIERAKTEFVSLAAHQLRTPLTTINWYSEMLSIGDAGKLTAKQRQYSKEIYRAGKRMAALVDTFLNVSRIEMGIFQNEPQPVNITGMAKKYLKDAAEQIAEKTLTVREEYGEGFDAIMADPKYIGIILQNLISNAIKYSTFGGVFGIRINEDDGNLLLVVSDNGIGIPREQQSRIFEKIFRADNAQIADPDGSGLGLYVMKEIVMGIGGSVWFESAEGVGSTFYVRMPLAALAKENKIGGVMELV